MALQCAAAGKYVREQSGCEPNLGVPHAANQLELRLVGVASTVHASRTGPLGGMESARWQAWLPWPKGIHGAVAEAAYLPLPDVQPCPGRVLSVGFTFMLPHLQHLACSQHRADVRLLVSAGQSWPDKRADPAGRPEQGGA